MSLPPIHRVVTGHPADGRAAVALNGALPSVVVQRGTHHAWASRSGKPCRMLFALVGGPHEPPIAAALSQR